MRFNIYNIFPPCYESYAAILGDLGRIKKMGFNVIFFNQFLEVDLETIALRTPLEEKYPIKMKGSLYAITYKRYADGNNYYVINLRDPLNKYSNCRSSPDISSKEECEKENSKQIEVIQAITKEALELGMIPIFDLVLGQAAVTCAEEVKPYLNNSSRSKDYDDVFAFDYTEKTLPEVFEKVWRPLIDWYIKLGFLGVRMDAVFHINPRITNMIGVYIKEKLLKKYEANDNEIPRRFANIFHTTQSELKPIIFGEMISNIGHVNPSLDLTKRDDYEGRKDQIIKQLLEERSQQKNKQAAKPVVEFTHGMCWAHELRPLTWYWDEKLHKNDPEHKTQLSSFNLNVAYNSVLTTSGVIGALETHDRPRLQLTCRVCEPQNSEAKGILIKEKILMTVITNGGWYMVCGNECGITAVKEPPFLYQENSSGSTFRYEKNTSSSSSQGTNKIPPFLHALKDTMLNEAIPSLIDFIKIINYFFSYIEYPKNEPPIFYFAKPNINRNELFVVIGNFSFHPFNSEGDNGELNGILENKLEHVRNCYLETSFGKYTYIAINLKDQDVFKLEKLSKENLTMLEDVVTKHKMNIVDKIKTFKENWTSP